MSFIAAAITAVAVATVGTAVYSADKQRKSLHEQQDAVKAAQAEDARKTAEAETNAALSANTQIASVKTRRRNNTLALGDTGPGGALGGTTVLGAGTATTQVASKPAGTALSAGAR